MKMFAVEAEEQLPVGAEDSLNLNDFGAYLSDIDADLFPDKLDVMLDPMSFSEFLFPDSELNDILDWSFDSDRKEKKIVHHDCMWAGMCSDKYHFLGLPCLPPLTPMPLTPITQASLQQPQFKNQQCTATQSISPGQSLLRPVHHQQSQPEYQQQHLFQQHLAQNNHKIAPSMSTPEESPRRPDTPQSLDEEDPPQFKHEHPIEKYINDDDEEGDDDDEEDCYNVDEYTNVHVRSIRESTVATDHSYTLSKASKSMRVELPGVQTPSDSGVTVNCLHPGVFSSGIQEFMPNIVQFLWRICAKYFCKTIAEAAQTSIYLCLSPKVEGVSGKYFKDCEISTAPKEALDAKLCSELWKLSEEAVGIREL